MRRNRTATSGRPARAAGPTAATSRRGTSVPELTSQHDADGRNAGEAGRDGDRRRDTEPVLSGGATPRGDLVVVGRRLTTRVVVGAVEHGVPGGEAGVVVAAARATDLRVVDGQPH